ncbi:hypothetical protein GOY07_01030 [Wolbachia endosymbiont of Litomosoides sigmodontis]|uniref:hypothetical protein n=1 Tax=Wolbachia endosymbiont of Litomosoides sigmodontis TaxID=80850 RepID=UPI00158F1AF4|nr:hypothetical protein [Wolbachia endosymbiont of Litomosoides sigmodontis]QKX02811.1 hypothetical protein GOY07_01030 [Wolbachia endosymbiont of Litomosoides sigmodontis]
MKSTGAVSLIAIKEFIAFDKDDKEFTLIVGAILLTVALLINEPVRYVLPLMLNYLHNNYCKL